jgi:histidine triad (HIT) family protein
MSTDDTIFTKIIKREIPADIVYEDEESIAFLDINPVSKGHTLLISKDPHPWMTDLPDELVGKMFIKAKKLMLKMKETLGCDYVQVTIVGKDVPHFHIHLMPRYFDDSLPMWPTLKYESETEKSEYASKIKNALTS